MSSSQPVESIESSIALLESHLNAQRMKEAFELVQQLLKREPDNLKVNFILAQLFTLFGKLEHGLSTIQQCMEWAPDEPEIVEYYGTLLSLNNRFVDTHPVFEKLVMLRDDPTPAPHYAIYLQALKATGTSAFPYRRYERFGPFMASIERVLTNDVPGEFVECGCFRGLSSHVIASLIRAHRPDFDGDTLHLFDSFEGLSEIKDEDKPEQTDPQLGRLQQMMQPGAFACSIDDVKQNMSDFPATHFYKGWLPQSLDSLEERTYAYVNLDVDLYDPTKGTLEYFWPRLSVGGMIHSDDYNWPGAKKAIDDFCANRHKTECELVVDEHLNAFITKLA